MVIDDCTESFDGESRVSSPSGLLSSAEAMTSAAERESRRKQRVKDRELQADLACGQREERARWDASAMTFDNTCLHKGGSLTQGSKL